MKAVPFLAAIVCSATFIASAAQQAAPVANRDSIATLVSRLDLERYKATVKGLTQFGDRRQGTARNRAAVDWIEAQLKSYGCTNTALRRIDAEPDTPGPREEVFCTKVGATHPEEMYIVGGHMDGHGYGAAANDDGSGTALVMELARVL